MAIVNRILHMLGDKDSADPKPNLQRIGKAISFLSKDVMDAFLRQLIDRKERDAYYAGRWDYPSGWKCFLERGFMKFPDAYPPMPKERRSLMVFSLGDMIEAWVKAMGLVSNATITNHQMAVKTILGNGHLDWVTWAQDDPTFPREQELYQQGMRAVATEIKSATPATFSRFTSEAILDDTFGYRTQQSAGLTAFCNDNRARWPDSFPKNEDDLKSCFVMVNKTNGALAEQYVNVDWELLKKRKEEHAIVAALETPEEVKRLTRPFLPTSVWRPIKKYSRTKVFGGNKLGMPCSYCDYKMHCWGALRREEEPKWDGGYSRTWWLEDDMTRYTDAKGEPCTAEGNEPVTDAPKGKGGSDV